MSLNHAKYGQKVNLNLKDFTKSFWQVQPYFYRSHRTSVVEEASGWLKRILTMLLYKSECLEIEYHGQHNLIETRWLGFASSDEYREGLNQYLQAVGGNDIRLWLGDYRLARVVRLEDQEWAAKDWFPRFLPFSKGITKMARVQAQDIFSQISSDGIKEKLDIEGLPFLFSEFKNYDAAKAWLLEDNLIH
ncbi:hypothetical protein TH63_09420 [Rufibacter radiotolerans]|uniref:SpoIIAA-like protein n=1 Tax=Rufibacter radiotolerans TaxID=1379910 RepID=A0A0H4VKD4_9BACT|nr:hypothetical protein [Rufibacter radiotolerans]AKQ45813.1 hypothetical protein TH63_09420 [Rufibacter radiotolerans]